VAEPAQAPKPEIKSYPSIWNRSEQAKVGNVLVQHGVPHSRVAEALQALHGLNELLLFEKLLANNGLAHRPDVANILDQFRFPDGKPEAKPYIRPSRVEQYRDPMTQNKKPRKPRRVPEVTDVGRLLREHARGLNERMSGNR